LYLLVIAVVGVIFPFIFVGRAGEAIDALIRQDDKSHKETVLRESAGMWKNRTDLPDFESVHSEWDRG
jgi:hypothetical protein